MLSLLAICIFLLTNIAYGTNQNPQVVHQRVPCPVLLLQLISPTTRLKTEVYYNFKDIMQAASLHDAPIIELTIRFNGQEQTIKGVLIISRENGKPKELRIVGEDGAITIIEPYDLQTGYFTDFAASIVGNVPRHLPHQVPATSDRVRDLRSPNHERALAFANAVASQASNPYTTQAFYEYFRQNPTHIRALLTKWYGDKAKAIIEKLTSIGDEYLVLGLDPGIAGRVDQLIAFARDVLGRSQPGSVDPMALRSQFEQHLASERRHYFRAVWLTQAEASAVQRNGLLSPGQIHANSTVNIRAMFDPLSRFTAGPLTEVNRRLGPSGDLSRSLLQSFSAYPEVATSIAYHDVTPRPGTHLYRIEVDLPPLSVIHPTGLFEPNYDARLNQLNFHVGSLVLPGTQSDLEVFSPFGIAGNQVIRITPVQGIPPRYEWRPIAE